MHMRGTPIGLTDTLHILWTAVWLTLTLIAMGVATAALGKRFTYYTVATFGVIVLFGALTGAQGARLAANLSTPGIAIYERINIGAFLLWVLVLAVRLSPSGLNRLSTMLMATAMPMGRGDEASLNFRGCNNDRTDANPATQSRSMCTRRWMH